MNIPGHVTALLVWLEKNGHSAWCVGGCVRDGLLGREPADWDVATTARPEETMAVFGGCALPTGLQHGTVTVLTPEGRIEVTTCRSDGLYRDCRHPDSVRFSGSIAEDLSRRDFTINAMALNRSGAVIDLFSGRQDLEEGVLRCVGEPDRRFQEDALRILRGLRFAARLGFAVEEGTAASMRRNCPLLRRIAAERIREELTGLLCGREAGRVLREFPEVVDIVLPELTPMMGFDQQNRHHCYDVWEHTLHAVDAAPQDAVLRWAALLHDCGKPRCFTVDAAGSGHFYGHPAASREIAAEILRRLRFDNAGRDAILTLVEWHDRPIALTDKGVRRGLRRLGEERLRQLIALKRADNLGQAPEFWDRQQELDKGEEILNRLIAEETCFSLRQLAVNGRDMMGLGLRGAQIGRTLEFLLEQVVDGALPNIREPLLSAACRRIEKEKPCNLTENDG